MNQCVEGKMLASCGSGQPHLHVTTGTVWCHLGVLLHLYTISTCCRAVGSSAWLMQTAQPCCCPTVLGLDLPSSPTSMLDAKGEFMDKNGNSSPIAPQLLVQVPVSRVRGPMIGGDAPAASQYCSSGVPISETYRIL